MHKEILVREQVALLPLIQGFSEDFVLVGGTAIALQMGHRQSIDFDLFSYGDFDNRKIRKKILLWSKIDRTFVSNDGEYAIMVNKVKIAFYNFPYKIKASARLVKTIRLPDLLTLAAMKAFALGRRSKWKDYVDLYFILKNRYSLEEISGKADGIFGGEFNGRIFREALSYFDDINYSEKIVFMPGLETKDDVIKKELIKFSIS